MQGAPTSRKKIARFAPAAMQALLGALLLLSGLWKLSELGVWAEAIRLHAGVDPLAAALASRVLVALETAAGLLLLIGKVRRAALAVTFALCAVYTAALAYVLTANAAAPPWSYGGAALQAWPLAWQGAVVAGVALLAGATARRERFRTAATRHTRWIVAGSGIAALSVLVVSGAAGTTADGPEQRTQRQLAVANRPVPLVHPASAAEEENQPTRLKALIGLSEWTALFFFQPTDCFSCIRYTPSLKKAVGRAKQSGLDVNLAGVALHTSPQEMKRFLDYAELPVPVLVAPPKRRAPDFYESISFSETPFFAIVGEDGRIQHSRVFAPGAQPTSEEYAAMFSRLP